jgi:hypothetical protein
MKPSSKNQGFPWWGKVASGLGVLAILAGGVTNADKIWQAIQKICCIDETPHVRVTKSTAQWGSDCLQFEFSNLPSTFRLGQIQLTVDNPKVGNLPGDQAATLLEVNVATLIDDDSLIQRRPIKIECRVGATQDKDAFFVTYCPVLQQHGEYSTFRTKPLFFGPADQTPMTVRVSLADNASGIDIRTTHPKNLEASVSSAASDCSKVSQGHR